MEDNTEELNEIFGASFPQGLPEDILKELRSILRLHSISPQELFYKWESYTLKMGSEDMKVSLETIREFKKDVQDVLKRESRGKAHARGGEKRGGPGATPRAAVNNDDIFGMCVTKRIPIETGIRS
jgi:DNA polymerase alpha subunit B